MGSSDGEEALLLRGTASTAREAGKAWVDTSSSSCSRDMGNNEMAKETCGEGDEDADVDV